MNTRLINVKTNIIFEYGHNGLYSYYEGKSKSKGI